MPAGQSGNIAGSSGKKKERVAGAKAAYKAVMQGLAARVYVARDAEERVVKDLLEACRDRGVEVVYVDSMRELGEFCGLRVGASACAILRTAVSR